MSQLPSFVHHVFFWLKEPGNAAQRAELIAGLQKLSALTTIKGFSIGVPADTNREVIDSSYAVSWLTLFATAADQDSYQIDPVHLEFVETCSPLWERVVVYDSVNP